MLYLRLIKPYQENKCLRIRIFREHQTYFQIAPHSFQGRLFAMASVFGGRTEILGRIFVILRSKNPIDHEKQPRQHW